MNEAAKDTYKYHVKMGHKVIDRGVTYDLFRREAELQERYQGCRLQQIGRRTTHKAALQWLKGGAKRRYRQGEEGDTMTQYRKKSVIIGAMQFHEWNINELCQWAGVVFAIRPDSKGEPEALYIPTLEGEMMAQLGDWIIRGTKGELYPCKPDIFEATYERVEETP